MTCTVCGRSRPPIKPPIPTAAVTYCAECYVPFTLDELKALFHEANMLDSNAARQMRRQIVDDLITALHQRAHDIANDRGNEDQRGR